jgi:hypothetical protein
MSSDPNPASLDSLAEMLARLHGANEVRDSLLGPLKPGNVVKALKEPPGELADSLFRIARIELEALNSVLRFGYQQLDGLGSRARLLTRGLRLLVDLTGREGEHVRGSAKFMNWLPRAVTARLHPRPFTSRDGTQRINAFPAFTFEPDGQLKPAQLCTLQMELALEAGRGFNPGLYFQEIEILAESEKLAVLTIQLNVTA